MARYDDLDTTAIAYTTFISAVILLLIILLGRALSYGWVEAEDAKKLEKARYVSSDRVIREQLDQLDGYTKVTAEISRGGDPANPDAAPAISIEEKVRIPIEKARDLLLSELTGQPSA